MPATGLEIFTQAELQYMQGNVNQAFKLYQKSISKILKNENVLAQIPNYPPSLPSQTLFAVWQNFTGFLKDPKMNFTQENSPEAWKLLNAFRPSVNKEHPRFTSPSEILLFKAMQIMAGIALGLLAWDKKDRATAAKRYKETLDLAATCPKFLSTSPASTPLERQIAAEVKEITNNLAILVQNDEVNANLAANQSGESRRRDVIELQIPSRRIEGDGTVTVESSVTLATDACAYCNKRDVKLSRCGGCKKRPYCGPVCQKADWKAHKPNCSA